jgi:drug/metabolite transporter (DMT)-like permease
MLRPAVFLALLTVQLLFAVHYVATKWLLGHLPAPAWVALRVGGAALLLLALAPRARRTWPRDRRTWGQLALLALFGVVLNQLLFVEGLSRTWPSHSALINTSIPVSTLALAVLLGREDVGWRKLVSLVLSLAGVLWLLGSEGFDLDSATIRGDLMCLANATSFALYLVLSRSVMSRLDPRTVTALTFLIGSVPVVAYGVPALAELSWFSIPVAVWWVGAAMIAGPTVGAYLLNNWALARVESSQVALFIYLQFLLVAPLSAAYLDDPVSWRLAPAAALVFAGVGLSTQARRRRIPALRKGAASVR